MADIRKIPPAINWHEGMLLAPQHFQQTDQRHESLTTYHISAVSPFHWGIMDLKIDRPRLVDGNLKITSLEAVMPDGLAVSFGESDADKVSVSYYQNEEEEKKKEILELDLEPLKPKMERGPLTIHLAVASQKMGVSYFKGDIDRHETFEGISIIDENTGDNELSIPRLKPKLKLLSADESLINYVSFPIAEITFQNQKFELTDFIFPALTVPLRFALGLKCSAIAKDIREKAEFVSDQINSSTSKTGTSSDLGKRLEISNLVSSLPYYEAVLNTGKAHPYNVYLALCSLAGSVAGFSKGLVPPNFAPYDHGNLKDTFNQVINYIEDTISEGVLDKYTKVPFKYEKELNSFVLNIKSEWMRENLIISVRGSADTSEKELSEWIENSWIGSESKVPTIREQRVKGLERGRPKDDDDIDIVPSRGTILFKLIVNPKYIEPDQNLCIFHPVSMESSSTPDEILLYIQK
jgi:type VI secretion system protein ImpJ